MIAAPTDDDGNPRPHHQTDYGAEGSIAVWPSAGFVDTEIRCLTELESWNRRKFSRELKLEAVRLIKDRGVTVAQAARDLDVHDRL